MDQEISPDTMVLSPISNEWQSAYYLPEFQEYFQSQGIYLPTLNILANFWWRLLAYVIDYILLFLLLAALGAALGFILQFTGGSIDWDSNETGQRTNLLGGLLIIVYNSAFEATRMQGSIGKTICKLKVVNANGERINFSNALGRNCAKIISSLICGMGFLNIFWNDRRQGWHDQMAKTFVVRIT
jgi:uncharacterized RDD family membrane protein YckC